MMRALLTGLLFCFATAATAAAPAPAESPGFGDALTDVVRDTCNKEVVLLGEATHGDGATVDFKVRLIERLVDQCGFDAVFFEANHYDFLAFSRKVRLREDASADMISSAIGRLWNQDREVAPLISFLFTRAKSGRLVVGGLDDQPGSAGAFYSLDEMPTELTSLLAEDRRIECRETLRRRILGDYSDALPYSETERARLRSCLAESRETVSASPVLDPATRRERLQMLASFQRFVARYPFDMTSYIWGRDLSMYANFRWLAGRLPPRSKIIIWAQNSHVVKDARVTGQYVAGAGNLGAFVRQAYGARAFALGFSAASGSFYWGKTEPARRIDPAAPDSLEARTLARSKADSAYLGPGALERLGEVPGSLFFYKPLRARWSAVVDGIVVFREQRPPVRAP